MNNIIILQHQKTLCFSPFNLTVQSGHQFCPKSENLVFKYKARHAHKRLYTVLPKYSKIQVLPGITSCRLVKDNKQAIELNSLLINNMPKGGYG